MDPRWYQIASLGCLLVWGVLGLGFDVSPPRIALLLSTALATQWLCTRIAKLPVFEPKSALISGLSLCLLLRTDSAWLAVLGGVIAIGSKFVFRWRGKHLFNPTNIAIVALLLATDRVWVSPGQWGNVTWFAFAIACLGSLVVTRARRADVTLAFLIFWAAILFARSAWLGQPSAVPVHRLQNGALLLYSFFMISDPRTTPNSRTGRIVFALLVALGAAFVQFVLYRTNGLLWSLAGFSLAVPLLDRWLPGHRYTWRGRRRSRAPQAEGDRMDSRAGHGLAPGGERALGASLVLLIAVLLAPLAPAWSFCGFYVAKADAKLYNKASKVALVRDGDRTVVTMSADYKGEPKDFAMVVPVPTVLEKEQVHVANPALLQHLDDFTAPRLVEYFDEDPCAMAQLHVRGGRSKEARVFVQTDVAAMPAPAVTVEASYTVGEYDIVILSATQSDALETWLRTNGYRIPANASRVLGSYIKQGMKFFVARVNLEQQSALGFTELRPLQIAYESPKFMLPIRLGMVNADGPQELFIYALTRNGRVEATNYRTVQIPSNMELPPYVKLEFEDFYRDMFTKQVAKDDMRAVYLEHAWDTGWCDPCAAQPLYANELQELGVMWLSEGSRGSSSGQPFVTRLHLRYDAAHFPEDLVLQATGNRENFQGRYVLRHPWRGGGDCDAARTYRENLRKRQSEEVRVLTDLTGWNETKVRDKAGILPDGSMAPDKWWRRLWGG